MPQILRGVSLMLCMVTDQQRRTGHTRARAAQEASGLFNLTRNLGGAVGLALINTVLNDRMDLHLVRLHEKVTSASYAALERLDHLETSMAQLGTNAGDAALKALTGMVRTQALVMSFADVFLILTVLFLGMASATLLIQRPRAAGGGGDGH